MWYILKEQTTSETPSLSEGPSVAFGAKDEDRVVTVDDSLVEEDVQWRQLPPPLPSDPVPLVVLWAEFKRYQIDLFLSVGTHNPLHKE